MNRKYVTIIILIVFAIVLTSLVVGILVFQPSQDTTKASSIKDPTNPLAITNVQGKAGSSSFLISVYNNGSSDITITVAYVNGCQINIGKEIPIQANSNVTLVLNLTKPIVFRSTYQITILSSDGFSSTFYKMIL